jgi:hypothetical protein
MIGIAVDTIGLYVRHKARNNIIKQIKERYEFHLKNSPILRKVIIVKNPKDEYAAELFRTKDSSAIVFFDCALELSNTEEELIRLWNEAKRVSGAKDTDDGIDCKDLFVLNIQRWSSGRLNYDPRVRWIITEAPPISKLFRYEQFGKRNSILAETKLGRKR